MELSSGSRIGSYEIIALLGAGGMGKVFRARDLQLGREVAIKVLSEEASRNEARLHRFLAEAKAASALNHPNILTVYGFGEENHNPYIVTELVCGITLRTMLRSGSIALDRALDIAIQTLTGLSKAHSIGILHRDIKPENLMITSDGYVKILDFGLAKLLKTETASDTNRPLETLGLTATETGIILGTAAYMSPEQARGQAASASSDLFSLGLVLYEMLAGTNPFQKASIADTISAILRDDPPPLPDTIPAELTKIVQQSLKKNPEHRISEAKEMEASLRKFQSGGTTSTRETASADAATIDYVSASRISPAATIKRTPIHKGKRAILGGTAVLLIALILGALHFFKKNPYTPATPIQPIIAVMAIENKTSDPELINADVGRILSDAFVQLLYDYKGVQVISPLRLASIVASMNRPFQDTSRDAKLVQQVSMIAEANMILSGSLSQIGQDYILTATLTELSTDKLLGSFRAESQGKQDLLKSLTSGITPEFNAALTKISGSPIQGGANVGTVATNSFEAYSHYVKGSDMVNAGEWKPAVEELQKAVSIDPEMAIGWSMLSCAYSFSGDETRANAAQKRALELKSRMNHKEQRWIDTVSLWLTGNGEAYRRAFEKYIQEFPDDREGYFYIGLGSQWLEPKDYNRAVSDYEKAFQLTPNYYPITKGLVDCYLELKQKDKAIAALKRFLDVVHSGNGHDQAQSRLKFLTNE